MEYEKIIETLNEISTNEKIHKEGLSISYELDEESHRKIDEHLFFSNNSSGDLVYSDIIEIENEGVVIKLIKKYGVK